MNQRDKLLIAYLAPPFQQMPVKSGLPDSDVVALSL